MHSACHHPKARSAGKDSLGEVMAIFASIGRHVPVVDLDGAVTLGIKADPHGVRSGWFNWPFNFDPVWLQECKGFELKEKA